MFGVNSPTLILQCLFLSHVDLFGIELISLFFLLLIAGSDKSTMYFVLNK